MERVVLLRMLLNLLLTTLVIHFKFLIYPWYIDSPPNYQIFFLYNKKKSTYFKREPAAPPNYGTGSVMFYCINITNFSFK